MGDFFQITVDKQASLDRAEGLSQKMVAWLVNRGIILPTLKECVLSDDSMGYPPWGFGNLGFKFWNWPPLLPRFVKEVEEQLGNEVVFVYGKI
jgi:hypothetical protein